LGGGSSGVVKPSLQTASEKDRGERPEGRTRENFKFWCEERENCIFAPKKNTGEGPESKKKNGDRD